MKNELKDRCMGHCCEKISLPATPDELKEYYLSWRRGKESVKPDTILPMSKDGGFYNIVADIWLIYPMLRYIGKSNYHSENPKKKEDRIFYHYSCIHLDKKTKKCLIYDIRPDMCITYPNKEYCGNPKCQWKEKVESRPKNYKPGYGEFHNDDINSDVKKVFQPINIDE